MFKNASIRVLCLASLAACASAPPLPPPPIQVAVDYAFADGAVEISAHPVDKAPPEDCKSVRCEVFALSDTPAIGSVEPQLAAVLAEGGAPFRATSSLPPATRWASPAVAIDTGHRVGSADAVLSPTVAPTFRLADPSLPGIYCEWTDAGVRVCFDTAAGAEPGSERAVLRQPLTEASSGLLFVPVAPAGRGGVAGHALVLTVTGAAAPEVAAAARQAARAAARRPAVPAAATWQWRLAANSIGAEPRRAAMLAVAAQLELPQCTDILLAADEPHLIAIGTQLTRLDASANDYAWAFQRAMWTGLLPGMQRDALPPGLRAAVIRRLGAVAAEPTTLQLHLLSDRDAAAFLAALVAENVYALDDRDPVHRVQAHDWLLAHDHTIAGYEPLAPAAARTAALRAHQRSESPQ